MWTCPVCERSFAKTNQGHSCGDKTLDDFLKGKSPETLALFRHFIACYRELGAVTIHPTKSMIAIASTKRVAYVIRLGRNFVDVVFPFDRAYPNNECFQKITKVPGDEQYNHHLRILREDDINLEVKKFMKVALEG
jgi:hypothetical protein